ncbi:tetratricopeptide repeat protein [Laceyella putida]|uniref:Tetratricopeptide repeat protein n=1 Tax=Laceyella putida TaxID=110101 RepID=A0ABW2RPV6_9BACL
MKTLEEININSLEIDIDYALGVHALRARLKEDIKMFENAAQCAKKGLEIARINYNYERMLELYIILADIYISSHKLHRAKSCLEAGIVLKNKITRRHWLILDAYLKLGVVHFKIKDNSSSRKYLQEARKIAEKENAVLKYAQAMLFTAKTFVPDRKYEEALSKFEEVIKLRTNEETYLEALEGLMQVYLLLGDNVNYIKYSKLYYKAQGFDL